MNKIDFTSNLHMPEFGTGADSRTNPLVYSQIYVKAIIKQKFPQAVSPVLTF